ncbi:phosphotransferase [Sphingomonas immobilis]|uniref:Phosphotransferase n=1 Tax=Sphingomonas immobilis TaxID=3063997 RepID=A0ABT9A0C3_9SPHN|nr:phosphotransferase [Sphingomonas sp. CA1-15]MDO7842137.1 phosphotransferase [Sphingomonas sp. CA1-15]
MTSPSPAPLYLAEILDPAWLRPRLYPDQPSLRITGAREIWREENTATKVRVELDLENAAPGTGRTICIKGMIDESGMKWVSSGTSATESHFYAQMAPGLAAAGINVPDCLYTAIDPENGHGLLIMKDMVVEGATFLTALTPYSPDQARDSLAQLARLHVETGAGKPLHDMAFKGITLDRLAAESLIPLDMLQGLLDDPRGAPLAAEVKNAGRLHRSLGALRDCFAGEPTCIVHGDAHAGNLYRKDGAAGIIDWQVVQHGHWAQDVAYHIVAALSVEDRRAHGDALLDVYLAERARLGDPVADHDTARAHFRAAVVYGYYMWGVTRRVRPDIIREFVKRLGLAVTEYRSFELLGV